VSADPFAVFDRQHQPNPSWVPGGRGGTLTPDGLLGSAFKCPRAAEYESTTAWAKVPANLDEEITGDTDAVTTEVGTFQPTGGGAFERTVMLRSDNLDAFDAILRWTAGSGAPGELRLTASAGTATVVIRAVDLTIRAQNWSQRDNAVRVAIANGPLSQTQNLHKSYLSGAVAGGTAFPITVPPYARWVTALVPDATLPPSTIVRGVLQGGTVVWRNFASTLRIPVSGVQKIEVQPPVNVASIYVDFELGYN